jgi:hypothetical protein
MEYLTEKEVADLIKRALPTLRNERHLGRGIPYIKCGRSVRYALSDVQAYIAAHRIVPKE